MAQSKQDATQIAIWIEMVKETVVVVETSASHQPQISDKLVTVLTNKVATRCNITVEGKAL